MKVAELEGRALDEWVALALGYKSGNDVPSTLTGEWSDGSGYKNDWTPSTNWEQAGTIIEREGIGFWKGYDSASHGKVTVWEAADGSPVNAIEISGPMGKGPTPLIAAMRAYVRLKFGKEVGDAPLVRTD